MKEKQYQIENRSKGNDRANLEWVGANEETPIIHKYLLNCGFNLWHPYKFWSGCVGNEEHRHAHCRRLVQTRINKLPNTNLSIKQVVI